MRDARRASYPPALVTSKDSFKTGLLIAPPSIGSPSTSTFSIHRGAACCNRIEMPAGNAGRVCPSPNQRMHLQALWVESRAEGDRRLNQCGVASGAATPRTCRECSARPPPRSRCVKDLQALTRLLYSPKMRS